jgi:hypothetical protein
LIETLGRVNPRSTQTQLALGEIRLSEFQRKKSIGEPFDPSPAQFAIRQTNRICVLYLKYLPRLLTSLLLGPDSLSQLLHYMIHFFHIYVLQKNADRTPLMRAALGNTYRSIHEYLEPARELNAGVVDEILNQFKSMVVVR